MYSSSVCYCTGQLIDKPIWLANAFTGTRVSLQGIDSVIVFLKGEIVHSTDLGVEILSVE